MPPDFQYAYPEPTEEILDNIKRAIAAVPKLYTQVLHLMNKMNLPVPFGRKLPALHTKRPRSSKEALSESESELSSEEETVPPKKQAILAPATSNAPITSIPTIAAAPILTVQPSPAAPAPTLPSVTEERNVIKLAELTAMRMSMQELQSMPIFSKYEVTLYIFFTGADLTIPANHTANYILKI